MDLPELKRGGLQFNCSTCRPAVQELRRCHEDRWDHGYDPKTGLPAPTAVYPIKITPYSHGASFCPAKLQRDDPAFCDELRMMVLAKKLGQVPSGGSIDTMDADQADVFSTLVSEWDRLERAEDFRRLATMLGGTPK